MNKRILILIAILCAIILSSCSHTQTVYLANISIAGNPESAFVADGPFAAGTETMTMGNGEKVVLYYPVDPSETKGKRKYSYSFNTWLPSQIAKYAPDVTYGEDAYYGLPISLATAFPVVLFFHGFASYPEQSSYLTAHLATWGFIVAAPDLSSRDLSSVFLGKAKPSIQTDLSQINYTIRFLETLNKSGKYKGAFDFNKVASVGHSFGGFDSTAIAASNPMIKVYVALAGVDSQVDPKKPALLMQGLSDKVVNPQSTIDFYEKISPPKRLVTIDGAGHNVFDDICALDGGHGNLITRSLSIIGNTPVGNELERLGGDGCFPPDLYPPEVWPLIQQVVIAQLRFDFGFDQTQKYLSNNDANYFHGVSANITFQN